jgi:hypothetical protein
MVLCDRHTIYGWGHHYTFASSVGYLRSDSVGLLELFVSGALVLYYGSLGTAPTLPRRG